MAPGLLLLPPELLHQIFVAVDPVDVAAISGTCKTFYGHVQNNVPLFKALYLKNFDKRPRAPNDKGPGWEVLITSLVKVEKILDSRDSDVKNSHIKLIVENIVDLLHNTAPNNGNSVNVYWLDRCMQQVESNSSLMRASSLYQRVRTTVFAKASQDDRQLSAKLHCYHGEPLKVSIADHTIEHLELPVPRDVCKYAMSKVYDLRQYTNQTFWGPFLDDGSQNVDWEKMEAIMVVLTHNRQIIRYFPKESLQRLYTRPFLGAAPDSLSLRRPPSPGKGLKSPDYEDPYNVTGTWTRVVCFLGGLSTDSSIDMPIADPGVDVIDYSVLFEFNFARGTPPAAHEPFEPLNATESIRLLTVMLKMTKKEAPGPQDGQSLPVVHFTGTSRSLYSHWDPNAESTIRGTVRLTPEGEVRWTTFSVFNGEERWRSEGIQIGGPSSARGVLGNWFDKDYDPHGPAGPTALWKVSNEINDSPPET